MTKKQCPLGEDCDLTIAWMKGAEDARDRARLRIEALTEQLEAARLDAKEAEAYSVWLEERLAKTERSGYANVMEAERKLHKVRIAELEEMRGKSVYLLVEAMFHLRGAKIKARRKLADIIEQVLKEWRSK
jgi:hypothetical protein